MADATGQATVVFEDGRCGHTALFAANAVNTGDTIDVGTHFRVIKRAGLVAETNTTVAGVNFTGTVLTIPSGVSNDGVWLIVVGVAL